MSKEIEQERKRVAGKRFSSERHYDRMRGIVRETQGAFRRDSERRKYQESGQPLPEKMVEAKRRDLDMYRRAITSQGEPDKQNFAAIYGFIASGRKAMKRGDLKSTEALYKSAERVLNNLSFAGRRDQGEYLKKLTPEQFSKIEGLYNVLGKSYGEMAKNVHGSYAHDAQRVYNEAEDMKEVVARTSNLDNSFKLYDHQRRRERKLERMSQTAAVTAIIGIAGAILFLSPNLTGNAINNSYMNATNITGIVFLLIALIAGFFWMRNK